MTTHCGRTIYQVPVFLAGRGCISYPGVWNHPLKIASPPLCGFISDGEPIDVAVDEPPTDTEEEEFRTPAAPKLAFNYRLRSRTVKPSARSRTRRNT